MPVYNACAFLDDAIRSIALQKHNDLEVIIVDDGSTDNSVDLAAKLLRQFSLDGQVLRRPATVPKGAGACRNFAAAHARGKYLAFLDSDDIWLPDHLAHALTTLESARESNVGVYTALGEAFSKGASGGALMPTLGFPAMGIVAPLEYLLLGMFIPTVTLCVNADLFRKTTGFSENLQCYEDWWLVLQLAQRSSFFFSGKVGCRIRVESESLTRRVAVSGKKATMSPRMYADQVRLYGNAKRTKLLSPEALRVLRDSVVQWNVTQLSDHLCALHVKPSASISAALASAFFSEPGVVLSIFRRAGTQTVLRGVRKAARGKRAPTL
jgi:hypothetical protein